MPCATESSRFIDPRTFVDKREPAVISRNPSDVMADCPLARDFTGYLAQYLLRTLFVELLVNTDFHERSSDALDYSRFTIDSLAFGDGQLVHIGWIYSYSAGLGGGCGFDPPDPGEKPGSVR